MSRPAKIQLPPPCLSDEDVADENVKAAKRALADAIANGGNVIEARRRVNLAELHRDSLGRMDY